MENAAEALKMAAAILIFVLALSIIINAFGEVRQTSQILLNYNDREYNYSYVEENRDEFGNSSTKRIVSAETIVPSIYKAYKENFKIIFKQSINSTYELYKKDGKSVCYIDLEKESLANDNQKEEFIKALLYGKKSVNSNIDTTAWNNLKEKYKKNNKIEFLHEDGIYDIIKGKQYTEYLGVYYQEEIDGTDSPDVNKTEKRVITYIQN